MPESFFHLVRLLVGLVLLLPADAVSGSSEKALHSPSVADSPLPLFAILQRFLGDSWAILGRFFTLLDAFFFFFNYNFRLPFYRPSSIDWTWILEGFFGDSSNYSTLFAMFDYQFGSSPSDWTRILEDSLGVLQPLDAVFFFSICSITILGHCSLIRPGFLRILDGS